VASVVEKPDATSRDAAAELQRFMIQTRLSIS